MKKHGSFVLVLAFALSLTVSAAAQEAPPMISTNPSILDGTAYVWEVIADGFDSPVGVTFAPDGSGRLFVWEQGGLIWIIMPDGEVPFEPFLDLSRLLPPSVFRGGYTEQGLLGLVFHPDYASNGYFFVNYTDRNGDTVVARYTVSAENPDAADPQSAVRLLYVDQPFENHNGGDMAFGPDGYLYISMGDGGDQGDPFDHAQNPDTLLGKILRIDVNGDPYSIPADNPFGNEVWAIGFRNPWRISFDRETGDLYIADVGEWLWEEINFQPAGTGAGANYGWNLFESNLPRVEGVNPDDYVKPVIEYSHNEGCSVTGGAVYRGEALPEAEGVYFFGDYCNGLMWNAWRDESGEWQAGLFAQTARQITSFGEDEAGELLMVDYKGDILRLVRAG